MNFLGITLDQNITWKPHITKMAIKLARVAGVLNKLKHISPPTYITNNLQLFNSTPPYIWITSLGIKLYTTKNTTKESS